jgi:3'(2'), 5'-bisphosphate nucleotidase
MGDVAMTDDRTAADLAAGAGDLLLRVQAAARAHELGSDALKDRGDRLAQEYLSARLSAVAPGDAVLSEEAADDPARLTADRVWIIDPLDGTREFSEGRADWAVHVALWARGDLVAGAVALPGLGQVLGSGEPPRQWTVPEQLRLAVSRSRPSSLVVEVGARLGARLMPMGSAGYKVGAVIRGEADLYLHSGGQYEWDSAAPVAAARAAGLWTSRLDGSPLEYNRPDPYLPDLLVCNPLISETVLGLLGPMVRECAV